MTILKLGHWLNIWKKIKNNKHFNFGGPLFVFLGGCLFYLTQTQSIRYEFRRQKAVDKKDLVQLGFVVPEKKKKSLEEIYEEEVKDKDLSQWENKRIPRPWEE